MKITSRFTGILCLSVAFNFLLTSCGSDDNDDNGPELPGSYNFENASYGGQITRLNQLGVLTSEMKSANSDGVILDSAALAAMYNGEFNGDTTLDYDITGKKLQGKAEASGEPEIYEWIGKLATASKIADTNTTESGARRVTSTANASKTYLLSGEGVEYTQLIEKGIMGVVFYYQGTSHYLDLANLNSDNNTDMVEGKDYTERQHHFDEAFGYFGAPRDLNGSNVSEKADNGEARYHAKYSEVGQLAGLNTTDEIMDAFIAGRYAIDNNNDEEMTQQVSAIQSEWEEVVYTTAIHYLKGANDNFTDPAIRCHELSEAYAFVWSLYFNTSSQINAAQVTEVMNLLGGDTPNFFAISQSEIQAAQDKLVELYAVDASIEAGL